MHLFLKTILAVMVLLIICNGMFYFCHNCNTDEACVGYL